MDIKNLGKTLAELRKKKNMSQQDLAKKLNVSNKTISKWECGNGTPDIISLSQIANVFGISLDELIGSTANSTPENVREEKVSTSTQSPAEKKTFKLSLSLILCFVVIIGVAISLLCYLFVPRKPEIVASDVFNVDSTSASISCVVDNTTDKFSFGDSIEVPRTNTWNVYYDLDASKPINSQTVSLQAGNNIFYIVVENSGGDKKTYEVVIRRKPLYVVSFNTNGGENITNAIIMEGELATYQEPIREGYIFDSWDFDFSTPITSNITINASWIAKNLVITYHANNGENSSNTQNITYNEKVVLKDKNEFIKTGHTLTSWNTKPDGSGTTFAVGFNFNNYKIPNDIELYAQWTINQYAISAIQNIANAGRVNGTGSFDYGSTHTITAITNAGYTWQGWYSKDNVLQTTAQSLTITLEDQPQEYIAKWSANSYEITLNTNGGNSLSEPTKNITFDQNFVLPIATRIEATFLGWFDDSGKQYANSQGVSIINWDVADNVTLYAHYKVNEYQVSLSENNDIGGEIQGAGLKEYGSQVTISARPKAGYSFVGWYNGNQLVSTSGTYSFEMSNYSVSYMAKWKANTYTVTMNVNGGAELSKNSQSVIFDNSFSLPTTSKEGYTFAGWYLGVNGSGQQITDTAGNAVDVWNIADDTIVYAKWNVINYKINYILNGGKNHTTNPSTYNVEDDDISLNYPTKAGYAFNGWVVSGASVAEKTMVIFSGSIGEKTYAASWVKNSEFIAISNAEELQNIQNNPNGNYYLTQDIDLSGFNWVPIVKFSGILDGQGFKLKNLTLTSSNIVKGGNTAQAALFLENKGVIQNIEIVDVIAELSEPYNYFGYFAILVIDNWGTIENCKVNAQIQAYDGEWGIIANSNRIGAQVLRCSVSGSITGERASVGGIVGINAGGTISSCWCDMHIDAGKYYPSTQLGGICAENTYGSTDPITVGIIENCYFSGLIRNGGIQCGIAYNYGPFGIIKNCFVNAEIGMAYQNNPTSYTIGNIESDLSVQNCYYSSTMTVPDNINKTGAETGAEQFKNKDWALQVLKYKEFKDGLHLWIDSSCIWVFENNQYPKLYWEL